MSLRLRIKIRRNVAGSGFSALGSLHVASFPSDGIEDEDDCGIHEFVEEVSSAVEAADLVLLDALTDLGKKRSLTC